MASLNICVKACLTFWILFSESFKLESRKTDFFSCVTKWLVYSFLSQNVSSAALFIPCFSCLYGLEKAGGRQQPVCPTPLCRYLKGVEASRRSSVSGCSQRVPTADRGKLAPACCSPSVLLGFRRATRKHVNRTPEAPFLSAGCPLWVIHTCSSLTGTETQRPWIPASDKRSVACTLCNTLQSWVIVTRKIGASRE